MIETTKPSEVDKLLASLGKEVRSLNAFYEQASSKWLVKSLTALHESSEQVLSQASQIVFALSFNGVEQSSEERLSISTLLERANGYVAQTEKLMSSIDESLDKALSGKPPFSQASRESFSDLANAISGNKVDVKLGAIRSDKSFETALHIVVSGASDKAGFVYPQYHLWATPVGNKIFVASSFYKAVPDDGSWHKCQTVKSAVDTLKSLIKKDGF